MKLTNKGRYAVMAMADLASNAKNGQISLSEISLRQNISLAYLEQIFLKLKSNKLVRSSRGANGGYVLEKPATEIRISNIIYAVDEEVIDHAPKLKFQKEAKVQPRFFTDKEIEDALSFFNDRGDWWMADMFFIGVKTGMRRGEE